MLAAVAELAHGSATTTNKQKGMVMAMEPIDTVKLPAKRAVLYIRSNQLGVGSRQAAARFAEIQQIAARIIAARLDAKIVREYTDRGGLIDIGRRGNLLKMLGDLMLQQDIDYLITHDWDRLVDVENTEDVKLVSQMAQDSGTQIVTVTRQLDEAPAASVLDVLLTAYRTGGAKLNTQGSAA